MSISSTANGTVTYQTERGVKTVPARITPKRILTATRTYERQTLRRLSGSGMLWMRVLSYQVNGEPAVTVAEPTDLKA